MKRKVLFTFVGVYVLITCFSILFCRMKCTPENMCEVVAMLQEKRNQTLEKLEELPPEPVEICGVVFDCDISILNLENMHIIEPIQNFEKFVAYPNLTNCILPSDASFTCEMFVSLRDAIPYISIQGPVAVGDLVIESSAELLEYENIVIKNKEEFERIIKYMQNLKKVVMCDCGYENDEMEELVNKYPHIEFVWKVHMGKWSLRTDTVAFSVMIYHYDYVRLTSEDISVLKYCKNLKALDIGHQAITDLSVLEELPELRVLILADNKITDLSPIASLEHLEYLELFVNKITDLSPLANCTNLVDLNIGWNRNISDVSAILNLPKLERLWLPTTLAANDKNVREILKKQYPNATITFTGNSSIENGWRTHQRYFVMRNMFVTNSYPEDFIH